MKTGTSKKTKYLPVHTLYEKLKDLLPGVDVETILSFHAFKDCDTVSYIAGHSKKTAWRVFLEDPTLVSNIGKGEMCRETIQSAEKLMCKVYNVSDVDSCDKARVVLFAKCKSPEALPPTSDALNFHVQRAHYQTLVWRQAHCVDPILPPAEDMGWDLVDGCLVPKLPAISDRLLHVDVQRVVYQRGVAVDLQSCTAQ